MRLQKVHVLLSAAPVNKNVEISQGFVLLPEMLLSQEVCAHSTSSSSYLFPGADRPWQLGANLHQLRHIRFGAHHGAQHDAASN